MFDLKSYIIGMVCILIGYIKGRSRKYDKLGA